MAQSTRLTADHLDEISQFLRLGLGLMLLVSGWGMFRLVMAGDVGADTFWDAVAVTGITRDFLAPVLFADAGSQIFTPLNLLTVFGGTTMAAGAFLLLGLLVRLFSLIFLLVYLAPWLVAVVEASLAAFGQGSFQLLHEVIGNTRDLSYALLFLVLFNIGPGSNSLDFKLGLPGTVPPGVSWNAVAFQLRMALAVLFLAGGAAEVFFGAKILAPPWEMLLFLSIFIAFALYHRISGAAAIIAIGWQLYGVLSGIGGFEQALDVFAPEAPFMAAAVVYALAGGGDTMTPRIRLTRTLWGRKD